MKLVPAGICAAALVVMTACSPTATTSSSAVSTNSPTMSQTSSDQGSSSTSTDPNASPTTSDSASTDVTTSPSESTATSETAAPTESTSATDAPSQESAPGQPIDAKALMKEVQAGMKNVKSFETKATMTAAGQSSTMVGQWDANDPATPKRRTMGTLGGMKMDIITIGNTIYDLQNSGKYKQRAASAKEIEEAKKGLDFNLTEKDMAADVKGTFVGDEAQGKHYTLTYPKSKDMPAPMTVNLWVDGEKRLAKMAYTTTTSGKQSGMDMAFTRYNEDLGIKAPAATQIQK